MPQQAQKRDHSAGANGSSHKILHFLRETSEGTVQSEGERALDLVSQAAELIRGTEERALEIEKRAQRFAEGAAEEVRRTRSRIKELEVDRQLTEKYAREVCAKLEEADKALQHAQSRISAAEDRLLDAERRAEIAEARATEAEASIRRIEEAIRTKLLDKRSGT